MDTRNSSRLPDEHAIDWAARLVGGRGVLAEHLTVTVGALGNWKVRGVPIEKCVPIERFTDQRVKRADLRPTDYLEIWPELAHPPANTAQPAAQFVAGQGA